jgi:predicted lipid-binding transport protein (Tim44 family)
MKRWAVLAALLIILCAASPALARGGGGCLARGTPILTPEGPVAIERLRAGDRVWSLSAGTLEAGKVQVVSEVRADRYMEITAGSETFRVTPEHPIMVGRGEYRIARLLRAGENVYRVRDGRLSAVPIASVRQIPSRQPAYNLLVMPGGTFLPAGIVVHNKGCFLPESEILKSDGTSKRISAVRPGDELLAYSPEGDIVRAKVRDVLRHSVMEHILLKTDRITLRVTPEHPFYVGQGTFKTLDALKIGDAIFAWDGRSLSEQRIVSLERVHERVQVFNLQTDHPNTFFAGGIAVHNKGGGGGCFPAGTMIRTPAGSAPVERLSIHDRVRTVNTDGRNVDSGVEKLFTTLARVVQVNTDQGVLRTTSDHPVGLPDGTFLEAGRLLPGNNVLVWSGGVLAPATVLETSVSAGKEPVYNLSVGRPHTFIAADFLVHNKGGSSSRSSSGSSGTRSSASSGECGTGCIIAVTFFFSFFILMMVLAIWMHVKGAKSGKSENLDYLYSRKAIDRKARKTIKLLAFLSRQDPSVAAESLRSIADSTFRRLQECWQQREYGPMRALLMDDLFRLHSAQLQGLIRNHEINRIDSLQVEQIDLVNVRYTEKPDQREFTALVTASARDYYLDDRTSRFLRGDSSPARFQEFWTFQRSGDRWLLREIEQAGESDILRDENFAEMLTDETVRGIYQETAEQEGKAGPWIEKETEEKATRIDRLLNFLVKTDKIWDRGRMLERARQIFLGVFLARESGDPAKLLPTDLFPNVAESLRKQLEQWRMEGRTVEYRNICVRKAELILVRNYADPAKDEFTVRISAHAQKIERKGQTVLKEQLYVTPFEEYWTFGRRDKAWKLKEVLPPARGVKLMAEENVDEDSSAEQMQWYYREKRAV